MAQKESKEPNVQEWFDEIDEGLKFRKSYGLEDSWADMEALFYNVHTSQAHEGPNIIQEIGDSLISALTVTDPVVMVSPLHPSTVPFTKILESVDNMLLHKLQVPFWVSTSVLHAFLWGKGILKFGYDSEFGWDPSLDIGVGASFSQFDKDGNRIEFAPVVMGFPWCRSVLPHDFIVPVGTMLDSDATWTAHRVIRHIDDIRADVKYERKVTRNLEPQMSRAEYVKSYQTVLKPYRMGTSPNKLTWRASEGESEYCELFEIRDRRTGRLMVVSSGSQKFLRNDKDLLLLEGKHPFVTFSLVPQTRSFWTTSDCYYLKQAQAELSDISLQNTKQRRLCILKLLYQAGAIDDTELDRLLSNKVGAAIRVNAGFDIDKVVKFMTTSNVNQQNYMEAENVRRNARGMVGFSRNQAGEYEASGRRTATEAKIVSDAADSRLSRRQIIIRDVYQASVERVNSMIFEFCISPRVIEVLGEDGMPEWLNFVGHRLKGQYMYEVQMSAQQQETPESRAQQALFMYQALMQDPAVDQVELRKFLINSMKNNGAFRRLFKPEVLANANLRVPMQQVPGAGGGAAGGQG